MAPPASPAGTFTMGDDEESPRRDVYIDSFYLDAGSHRALPESLEAAGDAAAGGLGRGRLRKNADLQSVSTGRQPLVQWAANGPSEADGKRREAAMHISGGNAPPTQQQAIS
jgi:hypothetical protein